MEKVQSSKSSPKKRSFAWEPFLLDLGTYALRGFVTGVSVKLGGMAFDKTFRSRDANLTVLRGGKSVVNG